MTGMKKIALLIFSMAVLAVTASAQSQSNHTQAPDEAQAPTQPVTTVDQAIDRMIAREHDEMAAIRRYSPIVETYAQDMKPDKDVGLVPIGDHYFLGQADLSKGIVDNSMISVKKTKLGQLNPIAHLSAYFSSSYMPPDEFLQLIYMDMNGLDRQHYRFEYVRREFLGDVRCVVFDVLPRSKSDKGRFEGRLWAEDQDYTIVRFNGVRMPIGGPNSFNLHFDTWRMNVAPRVWLPAFIFGQEFTLGDPTGKHVRFKSQTRLWGYDLKGATREQEFSKLTIDSPNAVQEQAGAEQKDRSPIEVEREWQHQAENNVLDRLERIGLLAPSGEVDKVLETVVNNLEVTNNLNIEPDVRCRILLTDTLESFSVGHTIVLSRGLIDVLPDEASLATMLAQELADILVSKVSTDNWGFNDTTNVSVLEALNHFSFRDTPDQVQAAGQKAVELLKNSPYKDKLGNAGLFVKQLDAESESLKALINPHLGNRVYVYEQLISSAPQLQPEKIDQIAALPIGARVKVDPWSDRAELLKAKPVPLLSAREKMPFEVTPFMPYLTRYQNTSAGIADRAHREAQ